MRARRPALCVLAFSMSATATVAATGRAADDLPGRPIMNPPPDYCQQGDCFTNTIESTDPILFTDQGVMFKVLSQNWSFKAERPRKKLIDVKYDYVFCSKTNPAVLFQTSGEKTFTVTFLTLQDGGAYTHANEIVTNEYFAVCHGRRFSNLDVEGPVYATRSGYKAIPRDGQETVAQPSEFLPLLTTSK